MLDRNDQLTKLDTRTLSDEELSEASGALDAWEACGAGAIAASWTGPLGSVLGCGSAAAGYGITSALGVDYE